MPESRWNTTDVLIVGAGPTGLALAGELLRRGVRCRIIDKAARPAHTSRALGLHGQTLETFAEMGIADQALAAGVQIFNTNVLDGNRVIGHFSTFQPRRGPYPFGLLLPQTRTEELLAGRVTARGGRVERGRELTDLWQDDDGVIAVVSDREGRPEEIRARWAAGCDGMHSCVRDLLGLRFSGQPSPEAFLLADVRASWQRNRHESYIWLGRQGYFAAMPLPGSDRWRLFAQLPDADESGAAVRVSLELLQHLLAERTGDRQTRLSDPAWLSAFSMRRGVASAFRRGRVFLAGDAAHVQGPFGGQGMNAGIQDACNLGWKLAFVIQGVVSPALLDTYEEERLAAAQAALSETGEASDLALPVQFGLIPARSYAGSQAPRPGAPPAVVPPAVAEAVEPSVAYRDSPLSRGQPAGRASLAALIEEGGPQPGDRAPDAPCRRYADGARTTLFEEWHGKEFRLLLFTSPSSSGHQAGALAATANTAQARLGRHVTSWVIRDRQAGTEMGSTGPNEPSTMILTDDGSLRSAYRASGEAVFLVRPDGYIAFHSCPASPKALTGYLESIGVPAA